VSGLRTRAPRPLLILVLAALALLALPQAAGAADKLYTVDISPSTATGGSRVTFTVDVAVASSEQQPLGSANLTAPSGFKIVSASVAGTGTATVSGSTVLLRDLSVQPGQTRTVTVVADVPCATGSRTWSVEAKQANQFQGPPGNDLTLDAANSALTTTVTACSVAGALRFATQPADARVGQVLTGSPYNPAGSPVAVEVVDASGNRVTSSTATISLTLVRIHGTGTLQGTTTKTAVSGVATFSDLRLSAPGTYRLVASSSGLGAVSSEVFRVDTVAIVCTENVTCSGSTSTSTTSVSATAFGDPANPDAGFLTLSFSAGPALDCAGYTEVSPDTALVDMTSSNRAKTVTLTIDKKQMNAVANNGAAFLEMCFGSPVAFVTKSGAISPQVGTFDWNADGTLEPVFAGLLPDCSGGAGACVTSRKKVGAGDGQIAAQIPRGLGDPAMRP
jgi:hypothetical protein